MFNLKKSVLSALMSGVLWISSVNATDLSSYEYNLYKDGTSIATQNYIINAMDEYFHHKKPKVAHPFYPTEGWISEKWNEQNLPMQKFTNYAYSDRVLFFCHGGGYLVRYNSLYRKFTLTLAEACMAHSVYAFDYRTAPNYLYPNALNDALLAYKRVLKDGVNPKNLIVLGDSAGGNLALSLMQKLKEEHLPMPKGLVLMSPWTAMTDLKSHNVNKKIDAVLGDNTPLSKEINKPSYAGKLELSDPRLSPLYADLSNLPETMIATGSHEVLYSDSVLLKKALDKYKVVSSLLEYEGMPHDFMMTLPNLPQTDTFMSDLKKFVDQLLYNK